MAVSEIVAVEIPKRRLIHQLIPKKRGKPPLLNDPYSTSLSRNPRHLPTALREHLILLCVGETCSWRCTCIFVFFSQWSTWGFIPPTPSTLIKLAGQQASGDWPGSIFQHWDYKHMLSSPPRVCFLLGSWELQLRSSWLYSYLPSDISILAVNAMINL